MAKLLGKLLVEFTKSRAYRTTDNALVEGKNGAVVRKHIGYGFIGSDHAAAIQRFYTAHFNPYFNFHRPCGYAVLKQGARPYATPLPSRRLPHTFRKTSVAAALAAISQTGFDGITASSASWPPQRYRSRHAHTESQTRFTQARAVSGVNISSFLLAPVNGLLDGEGGSTAAPFPLDPSQASQSLSERILSSASSSIFSSCSLRVGIEFCFQAHFALELNLPFRLIYGLENAVVRGSLSGQQKTFRNHRSGDTSKAQGVWTQVGQHQPTTLPHGRNPAQHNQNPHRNETRRRGAASLH
jgi:hypothetical protein